MAATIDGYTVSARIAPALLSSAPALCLGLVALPLMPGVGKLWGLLGAAVTTFAALAARRAGKRIQGRMWDLWGGAPTVRLLRYRGSPTPSEITRRHEKVERVLGGNPLPDLTRELSDPAAANAEYEVAVRRIVERVRGDTKATLLTKENRNYGFARNLYGLKKFGLICCVSVLIISVAAGVFLRLSSASWSPATALIGPAVVAVASAVLWRQVDPDFVRPAADAYADRLFEALDRL